MKLYRLSNRRAIGRNARHYCGRCVSLSIKPIELRGLTEVVWRYEIRDNKNHLLEVRRGFSTQTEAEANGNRALKVMLDIIPGRELKLIFGTDEA
jgi:hypothetical protein